MNSISLLSLNTFGIPFYLGWERLGRLAKYLDRLDFRPGLPAGNPAKCLCTPGRARPDHLSALRV